MSVSTPRPLVCLLALASTALANPRVPARCHGSQAFVPDWDDAKIKTKPREPAPWGGGDESAPGSTYSAQFQSWPTAKRESFKPNRVYNPNDRTIFNTRSTQEDSFIPPPSYYRPKTSFKPPPKFESVDWQQPITTTAQSTFIRYHGVQKTQCIYPKRAEKEDFQFSSHSTSQDSYQPIPHGYKPREPIYPSKISQVTPGNHAPSNFQTTFQVCGGTHDRYIYGTQRPARPLAPACILRFDLSVLVSLIPAPSSSFSAAVVFHGL